METPTSRDTVTSPSPPTKNFTYSFGLKEMVGERAVGQHLAHGDFASYFYTLDAGTKEFFEQYRGVVFEDWVDCYFYDLEVLN